MYISTPTYQKNASFFLGGYREKRESQSNFLPNDYLFGFNGQHKDNEIKNIGNSLDFGARIYDSRLGRFLSLDPEMELYPFWSPYSYAGNDPSAVDDGNRPKIKYTSANISNENGRTVITVKIDVTIDVAVVNASKKALSNSEGTMIAAKMQENAKQGLYRGGLDGATVDMYKKSGALKKPSEVGLKSYDNVEFRYEMSLSQSFRYADPNSIRTDEAILALSESHSGNDIGGMALYDLDFASCDLRGSVEGVYINSLGGLIKNGQGGNHEVGHLLGLDDTYKRDAKGNVISTNNTLMGDGGLTVTPAEISKIANNAVREISIHNQQKKQGTKPANMNYRETGDVLVPNNSGTPKSRIEKGLKITGGD